MNKRGVSPLIATVLIIGLTIALAAVIIGFSQRFTSTTIEETAEGSAGALGCIRNVGIRLADASKLGQDKIRIRVENEKQADISGLLIRVKEKDPAQTVTTLNEDDNLVDANGDGNRKNDWTNLGALAIRNYDFDLGKPNELVGEVEVFPKVELPDGSEMICEGQKNSRVVS